MQRQLFCAADYADCWTPSRITAEKFDMFSVNQPKNNPLF